jgi:hypothetical protein
VEKALELFPEAQKLATMAADLRSRGAGEASGTAGAQAAHAQPKTD